MSFFSPSFCCFYNLAFENSAFKQTLCGSQWDPINGITGDKNAFHALGTSTVRYGCCEASTMLTGKFLLNCNNAIVLLSYRKKVQIFTATLYSVLTDSFVNFSNFFQIQVHTPSKHPLHVLPVPPNWPLLLPMYQTLKQVAMANVPPE